MSATAAGSAGQRKLRVLLLTDEMEVGGTQRQIVYIACGLDRERFEPTVLFFRNPSFFVDELRQAGVRVIQIEKQGRLDLAFVRRLRSTLQQERFDVLHCFAFSGELWGAVARRLLPRQQRPVLISSVRGVYEWYSALQWRLKRWVSSQSQRVIANSRMGAAYACDRMGLAPASIAVSYNGVQAASGDLSAARLRLRAELEVPQDGVLLLFVGRLVVHKDVPTLLKALARLRDTQPRLRLALAGEGPLQEEIARQVGALALSSTVRLLGQRGDVDELIAASDILVLPSLREGLSNVILEGMMGGRAVVASRAGGNIELIEHQRSGLLFDIGDDAALALALDQLVRDAALRRRLGDGARQRAEAEFSIPSMVRSYEQHYIEAASEARPGPARAAH